MNTQENYAAFLQSKIKIEKEQGHEITASGINPILKPHQKAIVEWMVKGGRRACFASFGLGKSIIQLESVRITRDIAGGMGLIVIPLGVRQEFVRDSLEILKWEKPPLFIRRIEEAQDPNGIYMTNYETIRDGKLDPAEFTVATLDEASVLRGFGGSKTFREFMRLFTGDGGPSRNHRQDEKTVQFRFVATATPSPNDYIELLAYADFLGIMDVSQAKTRFFKRDSTKADKLTLHAHKEEEFWLWVSSWALFVQRPSDLGYSDEGYDLPKLKVVWHEVDTDHRTAGFDKLGQKKLFRDSAISLQDASNEKRNSLQTRLKKVIELVHDGRTKAKEKGVLQSMVCQEQRCATGEAACKEQGELLGEPSEIQGAQQEMERSKSREDVGTSKEIRGEKPRKADSLSEGLLQDKQRQIHKAGEGFQTASELRDDGGLLSENAERAERRLCDLRGDQRIENQAIKAESGSLPHDRESEGIALHELQLRTGNVSGQFGVAENSDKVSQQFVIWCDLNDEQKALEQSFKELDVSYSSLTGADDPDLREKRLKQWTNQETCAFISKPRMYGAGVNMQQCNEMIFFGIGFKFYDMIQAIHRIHRFLQKRECTIHLIYTEAERGVRQQLERKWQQHTKLTNKMSDIIKTFGLSAQAMAGTLARGMGMDRVEIQGEHYRIVNNDTVVETAALPENSIDLIVTSIPFSTQYEYSPNYADFGHSEGNEEFFDQMDFLTPNLLRALKPGRLACIHVKDRIIPGGMTGLGFQTVYPFHMHTMQHFMKHGFAYMGMKTIVTDVVRENAQTYRLGWTEQCKDGSKMGVGMPEYLLLFRKPQTDPTRGYADDPVIKSKQKYARSRWQADAQGFTRSSGNRLLAKSDLEGLSHAEIYQLFKRHSESQVYSLENHVQCAQWCDEMQMLPTSFMLLHPQSWSEEVWADVTRMMTLNAQQYSKGQEMHLCPLQFDIVDRCILQFTNKGDTVLDPFGGIMTVPYRAMKFKRKGVAFELNKTYFADGAGWCAAMEAEVSIPDLFDMEQLEKDNPPSDFTADTKEEIAALENDTDDSEKSEFELSI